MFKFIKENFNEVREILVNKNQINRIEDINLTDSPEKQKIVELSANRLKGQKQASDKHKPKQNKIDKQKKVVKNAKDMESSQTVGGPRYSH